MARRLLCSFLPVAFVLLGFAASGCNPPGPSAGAQLPPAVVSIAQVEERDTINYSDFTGRTVAVEAVEIKARATGYLEEMLFKEGDDVKKGQLLYRIDDRTYKANLAKLQGEVEQQQAALTRLNSEQARARRLRTGDAISREEADKIETSREEARAALTSAKAAAKRSELDLEFTKVYAPIDGRISKSNITKGNLVTSDQTTLTTIRTIRPIYAYFDVDERTVLQVQKNIREKKVTSYREAKFPVRLGTQIEEGEYPHEGFIDFVENTLDPSTGTLRCRGEFPNTQGILQPGLFVRIRLPLGQPYKALMVNEQALGTDQNQRFVFVVNEKDVVEQRTVQVGPLRDGARVILTGVRAGDWVIVRGLQRVREGATVKPTKVAMFEAKRSSQ